MNPSASYSKDLPVVPSRTKAAPFPRSAYPYFTRITTRWMDNDVYAHVNNVIYYSWIDTVVNQWLMEQDLLKSEKNPSIGWVVHSSCDYLGPVSYPQTVDVGLKLARIGNTSVHYDVGIFVSGQQQASAQGRFVHVYVDPLTHQPKALSQSFQHHLEALR